MFGRIILLFWEKDYFWVGWNNKHCFKLMKSHEETTFMISTGFRLTFHATLLKISCFLCVYWFLPSVLLVYFVTFTKRSNLNVLNILIEVLVINDWSYLSFANIVYTWKGPRGVDWYLTYFQKKSFIFHEHQQESWHYHWIS